MQLRLHEIECGTGNVQSAAVFFQSLLGKPSLQQQNLAVFEAGVQGLDFNLSNHLPAGAVQLSFLTSDLSAVETLLQANGQSYEGPLPSHLGMSCLRFQTPDGLRIVINTPGADSPDSLQVQ